MKHFLSTAVVLASLTLLAGCPSKPPTQPPPPAADNTGSTAGVADANANVDDTDAAGPSEGLLANRIIYFDFDKAEIRADSQSVVAAHAAYLSKHPAQKVRLEGHADERGSREYNIGLGERRGQAVRRALLLQGVAELQLSTVSYGEERPAAAGSDEQAYALNRRVEIVYLK
ncbi:MAG TPA: peptidoglycan-associated lipoprotein Pal [Steroidobacteraceae bacterium]|jgi:peptidoglycan-associated lipoprotein|nr:peptidoglycan-associated lipoprotein Pal [Steroidobacteraceae bacterium]